jgi:hypothetical protein
MNNIMPPKMIELKFKKDELIAEIKKIESDLLLMSCCYTCLYMQSGFCQKYQTTPPIEFQQLIGHCDEFNHKDVPF